jgi:hypothetical protein
MVRPEDSLQCFLGKFSCRMWRQLALKNLHLTVIADRNFRGGWPETDAILVICQGAVKKRRCCFKGENPKLQIGDWRTKFLHKRLQFKIIQSMEKRKLSQWGNRWRETSARSDKSFDKFSWHQTLEHSGRKICHLEKSCYFSKAETKSWTSQWTSRFMLVSVSAYELKCLN